MKKILSGILPSRFEVVLLAASIGWALLVLFAFGEGGIPISSGDGVWYNQIALNLIDYKTVSLSPNPPAEPTLMRTPGYPIFLAIIYLASGNSIFAARFAQFILLGLTALLLYRLARMNASEPTARTAAIFCVTYVPFIAFCSGILTETLITLMSVAIILALRHLGKRTEETGYLFVGYALLGLLVGAATLVRPSFSLFLFFIIAGIVLEKRFYASSKNFLRCARIALLLLVGFSIAVMPWLARNYILSRKIVMTPITYTGIYFSIKQYEGTINYDFVGGQWETAYLSEQVENARLVKEKLDQTDDEISENQQISEPIKRELLDEEIWKSKAKRELRQLSALQIARKIPYRIFYLWAVDPFAPSWMLFRGVQRIPAFQVLAMFLLAVGAIFVKRKELLKNWTLWILPVYLTLLHLVFHVEHRYTFPARPFMLIASAAGFVWILTFIKEKLRKRRYVG